MFDICKKNIKYVTMTTATKNIRSASSFLLCSEALKRNIKVCYIKNEVNRDFIELSYKRHCEYIIGQNVPLNSNVANCIVKNKAITKKILSKNKINTAKGRFFGKDYSREDFDKYIEGIGYPMVIKKNDGAYGNLVFTSIKDKESAEEAVKNILKKEKGFLVEKKFIGKEYRLLVTRNKFLAATFRVPANVVGDGVNNINKLVEIKNQDPRRGDKFYREIALKKIKIDSFTKKILSSQGMSLKYVPKKNEVIYLRRNSNISTGGDSIDVTDIINPGLKKIAINAVKAIPGLGYAGIDLMTNRDISKKPGKSSYIIVEINSFPSLSMHHFPYEGKKRNVSKDIIDLMFPETKK